MIARARQSWFRGRYCIAIARLVFYTADTSGVRLLLAWGSGLYAVLLVWPHLSNAVRHGLVYVAPFLERWVSLAVSPDLFTRPAYALMSLVPGGSWTWATAFVVHFLAVHWRALVPTENVRWAVAVNAFGLFLWCYSTLSLIVSLGALLPTSALEVTVILFSFWVLIRTGLEPEIVTA